MLAASIYAQKGGKPEPVYPFCVMPGLLVGNQCRHGLMIWDGPIDLIQSPVNSLDLKSVGCLYWLAKGKDNMLDTELMLQQFELIEQKVERVVQARQQLQKENQALNNRILQLENLIQENAEAQKKHEALTALVRTKIDSLIGRLEGITED